MKDETRLEKFWDKVDKSGECWLWTGSWDHQFGYGSIRRNGKLWRAHRWIFVQLNGYEPEVVMHTCDNPRCVRPDHLKAGTYLDNNRDMRDKGRLVLPTKSETCPHGHNDWGYKNKISNDLTYKVRYCRICNRKQWRRERRNDND